MDSTSEEVGGLRSSVLSVYIIFRMTRKKAITKKKVMTRNKLITTKEPPTRNNLTVRLP